ncbi:MAG TPA: ABC transporter permease [Saprospiraceae bacterium]|nr:ABC transporter permease [Saprospiraceae bacterium]HNT20464.1 ABC transporter permease [Saprospiraceae bacterium]
MLTNYLKIAWRNLMRYRFISFINLFGLTTGLTGCLLIFNYIRHELSFDRYHEHADRIYRVTRIFRNPETGAQSLHLGTISPPFGPLLKAEFPEIEKITRLIDFSPLPMRYEEKMFNEQSVFLADEHLFDVFNVEVLRGNPSTALADPFTLMLSEGIAKKYFGDDDPMDKSVRLNNQFNLKVTGVYKSFPSNTHMHPDILISFNTLNDSSIYGAQNLRTNWGNNSFFTYLLLPEGYDYKKMEARFPDFLDKHMPRGAQARFLPSQGTALTLQKLTDIHLHSHLDYEAEENGDIKRVYVFSAIALFILLIACINYMNLSTARSALRAREIGIRKTVGAERKVLITQFLSESLLISWMAMLLSLGFTWLLLPWLNKISGQQLSMSTLLDPKVLPWLVLVPFAVGLISGIYPALFMSSFRPVQVLKGLFTAGGSTITFRKALVTAQFAISIILIISTAVVFKQLRYMQRKSLGFEKDQIVTLPYNRQLNPAYESFRNQLISNSNIKDLTRSSRIPTGRLLDAMGTRMRRGDSLAPVNVDLKYVAVDERFLSTYGVKVVAGRDFSREFSTDTSAFLINEAAVQALGFQANEDALGQDIQYGNRKGKLLGVIQDFHFESMHQKIVPLILMVPRQNGGFGRISIKMAGNNIPAVLAHIEKTWNGFLPEIPYEYTFLDENFDRLYQAENRQGTIFTIFACLAIFIACLGLLGLSAFAISQRIKEIGIRKVLGAGTASIVGLLSKDFLKLVAIAFVVAFPLAWYAMSRWLGDFAYRIRVPLWVFFLAGGIAAAVALLTIGVQAVKAARSNPVKSLRTE